MIDSVCEKCEEIFEKKKKQGKYSLESQHTKISLGFLYHLALDIQFSFQAIALIIDFVQTRQAKKLQIKLPKIIETQNNSGLDHSYDQHYIEIKFEGKSFSKLEAQQLARSYYHKTKGGMDLLLGMFGIGKTGVFVTNNGTEKSVILFSVDDRINPSYFKQQSGLIYVENIETHQIENINGKVFKKVILQSLKIYDPNIENALQCQVNQSKILIFHPKIFVAVNKLMFYEIRQSNLGHDIDTHYNPEKIQFLNKLGYEMSIHSEFRLSCYLSCLFLQVNLPIVIGQSEQPICKTTYPQYLQTLRQNGFLSKINDLKLNGALKVELYETTDKYFMQNNGILLFFKGRMINRFEVEFGKLIEEKFYKKRYRSPPKNIWNIVGIIELDHAKFSTNFLKNKFADTFEYRRFVRDLNVFLENISRKNNIIVIQNDIQQNKSEKEDLSESHNFSEGRKRVKRSKDEADKLQ